MSRTIPSLKEDNIEYYGFSNIKYSDTFENNSDMK